MEAIIKDNKVKCGQCGKIVRSEKFGQVERCGCNNINLRGGHCCQILITSPLHSQEGTKIWSDKLDGWVFLYPEYQEIVDTLEQKPVWLRQKIVPMIISKIQEVWHDIFDKCDERSIGGFCFGDYYKYDPQKERGYNLELQTSDRNFEEAKN